MAQKPVALRIIRDEHLAIASVLYNLRVLTRQIREGGAPDFKLLHAMLDYIVVFPERLHHPKEDRFLFAALRRRCQQAEDILGELEREHLDGAEHIETLKATLTRYMAHPEAFEEFAVAVDGYAKFHWLHMNKEEEKILPLAEAHLSSQDWTEIAEAFRANDNPLFGIKPREQTELLYQKIIALSRPHADERRA